MRPSLVFVEVVYQSGDLVDHDFQEEEGCDVKEEEEEGFRVVYAGFDWLSRCCIL